MPGTQNKRRKKKSRAVFAVLAAVLVFSVWGALGPVLRVQRLGREKVPEWIDQQFLEVDGHSRRGRNLTALNDIVIHYVGNPGTSAQNNRDWFANPESNVSAHFVVGLEGEVIQCLPLEEISSASNHRNPDTISIEVCHPDETGKFTDKTYAALVRLTAWLCDSAGLPRENVIRHYDVTGKNCPKYFVENEEAWLAFLEDVKNYT